MLHYLYVQCSIVYQSNLFWLSPRTYCILSLVISMAQKKNSDAKIRANNKYTSAHYDRINMALPKGSRRLIEYCAQKNGESMNRYVCRVVLEAVKRQLDAEQDQQREFFDLF